MKLKRGITGFGTVKEPFITAFVDMGLFKSTLYPIEYNRKFKILDFRDLEISSNYRRLAIKDNITKIDFDILLNCYYPYYAGLSSNSTWMNFKFIDLPAEIRNCLDVNFEYLSPEELNLKVDKDSLSELNESELEQIRYWKSRSFGEIIFNGWD